MRELNFFLKKWNWSKLSDKDFHHCCNQVPIYFYYNSNSQGMCNNTSQLWRPRLNTCCYKFTWGPAENWIKLDYINLKQRGILELIFHLHCQISSKNIAATNLQKFCFLLPFICVSSKLEEKKKKEPNHKPNSHMAHKRGSEEIIWPAFIFTLFITLTEKCIIYFLGTACLVSFSKVSDSVALKHNT